MSDNGHSSADIITYIGVPLAVLGVLPILYNTAVTLLNASKIKRALRHSRLTALTRSDVVNRIIEIELPRYAVTPWDRFDQPQQYWSVSRHPSAIPGGSWTTFNWKTNAIGFKTQRLEYADQLRQPQVDVVFAELVCYLLDLGAVPEPQGWRLLRSTGLWTPAGCALMKSPDGQHNTLALAPLNDSDGNLSLSVTWRPEWTTRTCSDLPPYWVRLPAVGAVTAVDKEDAVPTNDAPPSDSESAVAPTLPDVTCQISMDGIVAALAQDTRPQRPKHDSLSIEHLRVRPGQMAGVWFASAATAYGTTSQTVLWSYRIPDSIVAFARQATVPCGVLVLLGAVDESATPEWATNYVHDQAQQMEQHMRRISEQRSAQAAEAHMTPAQRETAVRDRMFRESMQRIQEMRDNARRQDERRAQRDMEALQSPKWDTHLVAGHMLHWLQENKHVTSPLAAAAAKAVAGALLHRMVREPPLAASLCAMLDRWKAWADLGGMKKADLAALRADPVAFAQAALLMDLIRDTATAAEGTVAMDLQECLRIWRNVRLG